ncbi:MAG: Rab family GTPase [Candidatus Hodarchaeales archaeon]
MTDETSYVLKILLLGKEGVGKTSIAKRLITGNFNMSFKSTMGLDILAHSKIIDGVNYQLQIWDFGGQEVFKSIRRNFYDAANGIVLIFDLTDPSSLDRARSWVSEASENLKEEIPVIIAANKHDMTDKIQISSEEAKNFVSVSKLSGPLLNTSAKSGENIEELFENVIREIVKRQPEYELLDEI